MMTRPGDFNAGLQVAPTEASAVPYEHPFPSCIVSYLAFTHPIFVRSGSDQFCLFAVSKNIMCGPLAASPQILVHLHPLHFENMPHL